MMSTERASIFDDDDLDVSGFAPAKASRPSQVADKAAIREVAEKRGFQSREPIREQTTAPAPTGSRPQRRRITGRNRQFNIKATEDAITRFYAIADANNWVLGEAFEHAIDALEREVKGALANP